MKKTLLIAGLLTSILVVGCAKKPMMPTDTSNTGSAMTGTETSTGTNTGTTVAMVAGTDAKIAAGQKASWKASKVGGTHTGNIDLLPESVISVDSSGNLVGGTIVVAMNTIAVTDITDTGMNAKLVEHLKSADFFDVANYPTTKVVTTAVANNTITADITIRGVTKSITVPVTLTLDGDMYLLSTTLEIVRKDFGIADTLLGKVALEDNFTITIDKVAFTR